MIIGLVVSGVLILYIAVLSGIIVLAVNPPQTQNTEKAKLVPSTLPYKSTAPKIPLKYKVEDLPCEPVDNTKIIIKPKSQKENLTCNDFINKYCYTNLNQMIKESGIDRNLYISLYSAETISIYSAVQNINFGLMRISDIIFISKVDPNRESDTILFNPSRLQNFPRINLDNDTLYHQTEIPGYISYSTFNEMESYIGINADSIFIQDPYAKREIYDKRTDNNGYLTCVSVRLTSGKFAGQKIRLIHINKQFYGGYENIESFKVIEYLFDYIKKTFDNDIIIVAGNFAIRNELIQLAFEKTNLNSKLELYPSSDIVTVCDYNGASNPDAILIDKRLINECTGVQISTYSPWIYENKHNYVLTVVLENFKDPKFKNLKEIARSNWSRIHAPSNHIYDPASPYEIPLQYKNSHIEEKHIRDNPTKKFNVGSLNERIYDMQLHKE